MTRIFDNISMDLGTHLSETFKSYDRLDAAVGYFNLRGWSFFGPTIDEKALGDGPAARVLVGMTLADPDLRVLAALQSQLQESANAAETDADGSEARRLHAAAIQRFREQLMRGAPNQQDLQSLRLLRRHLKEGRVAIRLFTRRPMHGKAYICHRQDLNNPITAFVGSSNLTLAGLQNNYELNVDVLDSHGSAYLAQWFEDRWNDKFSLDITHDLIRLIDESWAGEEPPTPFDVFLKVCWHLSRDVREGLIEYGLPTSIRDQLLDYQASAVKTLARRISTRGGAMLGDVVGLGKTITATAVAMVLREEYGWDTLVICPKNLVKMWQEEYIDPYEIAGRVIPYSMAAKELPHLRRFRFVIIDESHTMRNDSRQDYRALKEYIRSNDCRVLLLTATPFNTRFSDVANQVGLYIDDDDDVGLQPLAALAKDSNLADKVDQKVTTLAAFRRSDEPEDWKRLMSDHLVRRTRSFVRANYASKEGDKEYLTFLDGERFFFSKRLPKPVNHTFGEGDPAAKMVSDRTLVAVESLRLPRYGLAEYLNPQVETTEGEGALIAKWERARGHLSGFVRVGLYKRLSSCGHSFLVSLNRHKFRNDIWVYAIDGDLDIPVGTVLDAMMDGADAAASTSEVDEDPDDLTQTPRESLSAAQAYRILHEKKPPGVTWVRPGLFTSTLRDDLEADNRLIEGLLEDFGPWDPKHDSKLTALYNLVTKQHPKDKVLVFTEYKDTALYLESALRQKGLKDIAVVTGDSTDPTQLARRFSPQSNRRQRGRSSEDDEIRVLIATDVLSEGQNLQDSHIIASYDLPWAIVRLIQRAGRVDRVGQKSDTVYVYSFFHDDVENVLDLRRRIRERLEKSALVFGSDEKFFGSDSETVVIEGLYNGDLPDEEDDAENDAGSLAYEIWMRSKEDDPQRAARVEAMPDLVYATRTTRPGEEAGVAVYIRTERGHDGFGHSGNGSLTLLTAQEALKFFSCEPDDPSRTRQTNHFEQVLALVKGPLQQPELAEGRLRGVRKKVWNRLNGNFAALDDQVASALDALYQRPLTAEAEQKIASCLSTRDDDELSTLLAALNLDGRLVIADSPGTDPIRIVCSMGARA